MQNHTADVVNGRKMILKRFMGRSVPPHRDAYVAIVAAARHDVFYADWLVPDTVDGRFDMITLHMFLVLDRLKGSEARFRQDLVDEFFRDMDRSLREMGVGDLSVGKKVRKMAEAFYGRIAAYDKALAAGDDASLEQAIARNVFPEGAPEGSVKHLANHIYLARQYLVDQNAADIAAGRLRFRDPSP